MSVRIIIAGGGTGGHIFPALAIADALRQQDASIAILFVGAVGKMEMEKVPQAGYPIRGIDIIGFGRTSWLKNMLLPYKLLKSFWQAGAILKAFRPHAVLGVGGYSSFPVLRVAQLKAIPTFLHEANAFAGKANRLLAKRVRMIFAGTPGLEQFFPANKICFTGNPVREVLCRSLPDREKAAHFFHLSSQQPILLIMGGSLGARSINQAISKGINNVQQAGIQLIWQTGVLYTELASRAVENRSGCYTAAFIKEMEMAYAAADVVIARSGAMTVAELAVVGKPVLLVPFPLATEDHQRLNAEQLVNQQAALLIPDYEAAATLVSRAIALCLDKQQQASLREALSKLAIRDAASKVASTLLTQLEH